MTISLVVGDVFEQLRAIPDQHFYSAVFSPPYWGLRKYIEEGAPEKKYEIGLEPTLGEHIAVIVAVMCEIRRVVRIDGTVWLNYGDCYAAKPNTKAAADYKADGSDDRTFRDKPFSTVGPIYVAQPEGRQNGRRGRSGNLGNGGINGTSLPAGRVEAGGLLKPKDLCMIPNRLAIALQDDGWYVRSEIIWHKPNPMPESVYDRPTTSHEKIWLLTRSEDYYYDHEAIREACVSGPSDRKKMREQLPRIGGKHLTSRDRLLAASGLTNVGQKRSVGNGETRNTRNVWSIAPKPFREAHFATFPPALAERCIKAGTPPTVCGYCGAVSGCGAICTSVPRVPGRVLDPFGGAGTVGLVAERLGRDSTLIELSPTYADIARRRCGIPSEPQPATAAMEGIPA